MTSRKELWAMCEELLNDYDCYDSTPIPEVDHIALIKKIRTYLQNPVIEDSPACDEIVKCRMIEILSKEL